MIVRGSTLAFVLQDAAIKADFADVCLAASTVVCCRVTPAQKAQVVAIAKERGALTLAIGDGGNDVGMIQEVGFNLLIICLFFDCFLMMMLGACWCWYCRS